MASLLRYHRSLVWNADDGLLLWEVARKTPEGMTCGVCRSQRGKEILEQYGRTLADLDKPLLLFRPETENQGLLSPVKFKDLLLQFEYKGTVFDRLFFRDPFAFSESVEALAKALAFICAPHQKRKGKVFTDESEAEKEIETKSFYETDAYDGNADENSDGTSIEPPLADGWCAVISQKIPSGGQHISELIKKQILTPSSAEPYLSALEKMEQAEKSFFGDVTNPLFNWNCESIAQTFRNAGFAVESAVQTVEEKRRITLTEIRRWFDTKTSAYGTKILEAVGAFELQKLITLLENASANAIFSWKTETAYFTVRVPKAENKPDN